MPAANFPASPVNGQTYTVGNITYTWNSTDSVWNFDVITSTIAQMPVGSLTAYAGSSVPSGWLLCAGQEVSRTTYAALDSVIGTTYGAYTNGSGGAGTTHMRLPDLRGRSIFGKDDMNGTAASRVTNAVSGITGTTLGSAGGDQRLHSHTHIQNAHTHTQDAHNHTQNSHGHTINDPGHTHSVSWLNNINVGVFTGTFGAIGSNTSGNVNSNTTGISINSQTATNQSATATNQNTTATNQTTGAGASENMPPSIILNYIIKT